MNEQDAAMRWRRKRAMEVAGDPDIDPLELLASVVAPNPAYLELSLEAVRKRARQRERSEGLARNRRHQEAVGLG
jgi:hypothetical protein